MLRQKSLPLETVSGSFGCSFTRFSCLTVVSSVSTAPRLLRFPQEALATNLHFSHKIRRPRQACSIMKRLERRVLSQAPGNPLARFWSCRQYYCQYEAHYRENTPCCCSDLQSTTPFAEHYTYNIAVKLPDELWFMLCGPEIMPAYQTHLQLQLTIYGSHFTAPSERAGSVRIPVVIKITLITTTTQTSIHSLSGREYLRF